MANRKNIKANVYDLNQGFDLLNMDVPERNEFIFWHPPYHNMIRYADNMYAASEIEKNMVFMPMKWIYHSVEAGKTLLKN